MLKRDLLAVSMFSMFSLAACTKQPAEPTTPKTGSSSAGLTADQYRTQVDDLTKKLLDVFTEQDCDKLAHAMTKFTEDNTSEISAIEDYEKAHPEAREQTENRHHAELDKTLGPAMEKCTDNTAFNQAAKTMPK